MADHLCWVQKSWLTSVVFYNLKCATPSFSHFFGGSIENSNVILMDFLDYDLCFFSSAVFKIFSLFCIFNVLTMVSCGVFLILSCLGSVCILHLYVYVLLYLQGVFYDFAKNKSVSLVCHSSPPSCL